MDISISDAETHLRDLIERVAAGETVTIVQGGQAIARLIAAEPQPTRRQPVDFAAIRALRETLPEQAESAGDFIRRMRDEDRY